MDPYYRMKLCRICFKAREQLLDIFGKDSGDEQHVKDAFANVLTDNVLKTDLLPQKVCYQCLEVLLSFKFFKDNSIRDKMAFMAQLINANNWVHESGDSSKSMDTAQKVIVYIDGESEELKNLQLMPGMTGEVVARTEKVVTVTSVAEDTVESVATPGCSTQMDEEPAVCAEEATEPEGMASGTKDGTPNELDESIKANPDMLNSDEDDEEMGTDEDSASASGGSGSEEEDEEEEEGDEKLRKQHTVMRPLLSDDGLFVCRICDRGFKYKNLLKTHYKEHDALKPFQCPHCDKRYKRLEQLNQHVVVHSDYRPYECEICGARLRHKTSLLQHKKCHSGVKETFLCWQCGNTYNSRCTLNRHILLDHDKVKPFICLECNREFKTASKYEAHQNQHKGIKPFPCPTCGRRFGTKVRMQEHVVVMHTEEKSVVCDLCDKPFALRRYMNLHKRVVHKKYAGGGATKRSPPKKTAQMDCDDFFLFAP